MGKSRQLVTLPETQRNIEEHGVNAKVYNTKVNEVPKGLSRGRCRAASSG